MKIKRFVASDMRQAIRRVREEQGPDAVILANRKVPEGVEIIAALDYDEEALYRDNARDEIEEVPAAPRRAAPPRSPQAQPGQRRQRAPSAVELAGERVKKRAERETRLASFDQLAQRFSAEVGDDDDDDFDDQFDAPYVDGDEDDFDANYTQDLASTGLHATPQIDYSGYGPLGQPERQQAARAERSRPVKRAAYAPPAEAREPAPRRAQRPQHEDAEALRRRAEIAPEELDALNDDYPRTPSQAADKREGAQSAQGPALGEMQRELQALRGLMENQLSVMEWSNVSRRQPLRVALLSRLDRMDFGSDVAEAIAAELGEQTDIDRAWRHALALLAKRIPIADDEILNEGGVVAVVGPTGVGKTTTVAKLAARFAMRHGARNVALVTTDNYRIGAQEQLLHYARILGVPLKTANDSAELAKILSAYYDKKLVLIDTAGMSQRDLRLTEQFATLRDSSPLVRAYLVLSANAQLATLDETVRAFNRVDLAGAIITKLDEAATIGGALTAAIRHRLPIACVGVGQRVPEDLQPARAHRLISRAVPESGWEEVPSDPEALAVKFGGKPAHAHG